MVDFSVSVAGCPVCNSPTLTVLLYLLHYTVDCYRFIPRHADELELDVDDPLFVEEEEDDYWYRGYNMRTGATGIFPAYYAHEVIGQTKDLMGENSLHLKLKTLDWSELSFLYRFCVFIHSSIYWLCIGPRLKHLWSVRIQRFL